MNYQELVMILQITVTYKLLGDRLETTMEAIVWLN